jgi:rhamnulokinase
MSTFIAVDLGNESGRIMRVVREGERLTSHEVYRFPNNPVTVRGTLTWDVLRLWHEIEQGLDIALRDPADGIGVASFGVDFGLLDGRGALIANPVHMRDGRTDGMMEWVFERVPKADLWQRSGGIGFHVINTLYQLAAIKTQQPWQLDAAQTLLTMPNLINYWLTGEALSEFTHTTTTQCYNPLAGDWDRPTLEALDIPTAMLPPVVHPGTRISSYRDVPVYAVASHDTGSAVVAVPAETPHYAYISSGTWSLFGVETTAPLLNDAALHANITSEGGAFGTFRPLKLVMGLWILQQCRVAWKAAGTELDYGQLMQRAERTAPLQAWIDPDDPLFFTPGDMPARVRAWCEAHGQRAPQGDAAITRCVLESLALKYRLVLEQLIAASGQPVEVIHIVGGGAQNPLLCQMTANATGRPVVAGPAEATALGNALVQMIGRGDLRDLAEARALVRASTQPTRYTPQDSAAWDAAYGRFVGMVGG